MAQKIIFGGIAASGIVGVLFVMRITLRLLKYRIRNSFGYNIRDIRHYRNPQ